MKTTPVTQEDLTRSVIAVPPLCRNADADFSLNVEENRRLVQHLEGGGVSTLLYGGNANLYNIAVSEYASLLAMLEEIVADDTWVVPSVGPMYGTILDQAAILAPDEGKLPIEPRSDHRDRRGLRLECPAGTGLSRGQRPDREAAVHAARKQVLTIQHEGHAAIGAPWPLQPAQSTAGRDLAQIQHAVGTA